MGLSESFGFEPRWLRLLLKVIPRDPSIFRPERIPDAQFLLGGLGNRQVLAVRDWAKGIGLIKEHVGEPLFALTRLGQVISEYDPQLEEDGSFWVIHHRLCLSEDIWFYSCYSNLFGPGTFSRTDIKARLKECKSAAESVIEKKCLVPLLHTMKSTRLGNDLGVLAARGGDVYERCRPDERRLHDAVVAFMLSDYAQKLGRRTANILELSTWGGVARYLALSEQQLNGFLDRIQDRYSKEVLWVSRTAGLNSITFAGDVLSLAVLRAYYLEHLEGMQPPDALQAATRIEQEQRRCVGDS